MTRGEKKVKRWRFGLWQLFMFTAVIAVMIWLSKHMWVEFGGGHAFGGYGGHFTLEWDNEPLIQWTSYPEPWCGGIDFPPAATLPGPVLPTESEKKSVPQNKKDGIPFQTPMSIRPAEKTYPWKIR